MDGFVKTYTDAPADYDGFGTKTLAVVGTHKASSDRPIRLVETPDGNVQWQRQRYGSGTYFAYDEAEWARFKVAPFFILAEEKPADPFAAIARIVRERAGKAADAALDAEEAGQDAWDARDDAELLRVLARILEGKTPAKAFGAPGDWGHHTPIGAALSEYHRRGRTP